MCLDLEARRVVRRLTAISPRARRTSRSGVRLRGRAIGQTTYIFYTRVFMSNPSRTCHLTNDDLRINSGIERAAQRTYRRGFIVSGSDSPYCYFCNECIQRASRARRATETRALLDKAASAQTIGLTLAHTHTHERTSNHQNM